MTDKQVKVNGWVGSVILILALLVPSVASAQILPPYVPPAPRGTQYAVPWRAIRPIARWGVRANYWRPPQAPQPYRLVPGLVPGLVPEYGHYERYWIPDQQRQPQQQ